MPNEAVAISRLSCQAHMLKTTNSCSQWRSQHESREWQSMFTSDNHLCDFDISVSTTCNPQHSAERLEQSVKLLAQSWPSEQPWLAAFEAATLTTVRTNCEKQLNGAATMSGNDLFISRLSDRIWTQQPVANHLTSTYGSYELSDI